MAVVVTNTFEVDLGDGQIAKVTPEKMQEDPHIEVTCDYSKCGDGTPRTIKWSQLEVARRPEALPAEAKRCITLTDFQNNKLVFCSGYCAIEHLVSVEEAKREGFCRKGLHLVKR